MILASTCGLFGSEFYSIYNPLCSNVIIEYGRLSCNVAKQCLLDLGITD